LYTFPVQPFDGLRLGLLAEGYRLIHYHQFSCYEHGIFRAGIEAEECNGYRCPVCQRKCKTIFLAAGYSRRETPLIEQIVKPLMRVRKVELQAKGQETFWPQPYHLRL
jgi:hypothetical protein